MQKKIKKVALIFAAFFGFYIVLELTLFVMLRFGRGVSPKLDHLAAGFEKIEKVKVGGPCSFKDGAKLDPYHAYYLANQKKCYPNGINVFGSNHSNKGAPYDSEAFNILFVGGSVSDMFAHHQVSKSYFFEDYLNRHYLPPKPKKYFKVLNAAVGEGRQPMQFIKSSMNTELFDALISIEGFNEFATIFHGAYLFTPPHVYTHQMAGLKEELGRSAREHLIKFAKNNRATMLGLSPLVYSMTNAAYNLTFSLWPTRPPEEHFTKLRELEHPFLNLGREEKLRSNMSDYRKILRSLAAVCFEHKKKCMIFFQPISSHQKILTSKELNYVSGDQFYQRRDRFNVGYQRMVDDLLKSSSVEFPIFSLVDIFKDVRHLIYDDFVHFAQRPEMPGLPTGYDIMAKKIATTIEKPWGLQPRN